MMSLGDRFGLALRALTGAFPTTTSDAGGSMLFGVSQAESPPRGSNQFLQAYSTMPWLRAVTHRIADSIAATQWHLFAVKRGGRFRHLPGVQREHPDIRRKLLAEHKAQGELIQIDDHPLLQVLHGANTVLTGGAARKLTQLYMDILGEAFWIKERNMAGVPIAIWPIPPTWVKATPTPAHPFYQVSFRGWQGDVPATEVLWFLDPNPSNPYGRGTGIANALADELEIDEYAAKHTKAWFYNDATPSMIVSPTGEREWAPAQREQLKRSWLQDHQGFWRAFKVKFSGRDVKVQQLSHTFADQQLIALRQHERNMVVQVFGVPPEVLGIIENSNRATIDAAQALYGQNVLVPRLEVLRESMQERLIPEYDVRLILDYENPVPADKEFRLRAAQVQPQSLTQNEWRGLAGQPPKDDGDVHHIPFNLQPSVTLGGIPPRPRARAHLERHPAKAVLAPPETKALNVDESPDDDFFVLIHRAADQMEPKMKREFLAATRALKNDIDRDALLQALIARNVPTAEDAIPFDAWATRLQDEFQVTFQQTMLLSGEASATELSSLLDIAVQYNAEHPAAVAFAREHAGELISDTGLVGESRQAIRAVITDAFETGMQPTDLMAAIEDSVGLNQPQAKSLAKFRQGLVDAGVSPAQVEIRARQLAEAMRKRRAAVIARTELIDVASEGQEQLWRQAVQAEQLDPKQARRFWLVALDDRLDTKICEPIPFMNPAGVALNEPFETPEGPKMRPTAHPNCRCTVALRFAER